MKRSIKEFKDIHKGQDIWVIAKGASLNFINKSFFDGKITVGMNDIDAWYPTTYLMRKEFNPEEKAMKPKDFFEKRPNTKLVMSEYVGTVQEWGLNEVTGWLQDLLPDNDVWFFTHPFTHGELVLPNATKGEEIPASLSSCAMAMWFSAYLGAKNIILCGNDECRLDGKDYVDGVDYFCSSDHDYILKWQASQSIVVRNILRDSFGINIYSLHPFINLGLEGHKVIM